MILKRMYRVSILNGISGHTRIRVTLKKPAIDGVGMRIGKTRGGE